MQRLVEETSKDTLDIAAALAFLAAGKTAFYDSMPKIESKRSQEDRRDRETGAREKNSLGDNDRSEESHSATIISKARLDGRVSWSTKRDIVGAIANEVGLDPQHMGKIRMFKDHSFIDLPKTCLLKSLKLSNRMGTGTSNEYLNRQRSSASRNKRR